jgi:hypothetical protein
MNHSDLPDHSSDTNPGQQINLLELIFDRLPMGGAILAEHISCLRV